MERVSKTVSPVTTSGCACCKGTRKKTFLRKDFPCIVDVSVLLNVLSEYGEVVKFILLTEYNNLVGSYLSKLLY